MPKKKEGSQKRPIGRPRLPEDKARRNRVVITITSAEYAAAERLAEERGIPIATVLYEMVSRSLRRHTKKERSQ